jgi:hypothetical protein
MSAAPAWRCTTGQGEQTRGTSSVDEKNEKKMLLCWSNIGIAASNRKFMAAEREASLSRDFSRTRSISFSGGFAFVISN